MLKVSQVKTEYTQKRQKLWESGEISFSVARGEILALTGNSGCGKTTLLRVLAGVKEKTAGTITFDGRTLCPKQVRIGLIPQGCGLLPHKTLWENGFFCTGKNPASKERLEHLLKQLGIWEVRHSYPARLSGGQAQRAALARALLMEPELLLMDEPFSALDAPVSREAQELTLKLQKQSRAAGILITHRMEEAFFMADRILVLGNGAKICGACENPWKGKRKGTNMEYQEQIARMEELLEHTRRQS